MNVEFTLPAASYIDEKIDPSERAELQHAFRKLVEGKIPTPVKVIRHVGDGTLYVARAGRFRIIFFKDEGSDKIVVASIAKHDTSEAMTEEISSLTKAVQD